jgi:hypothetical protein
MFFNICIVRPQDYIHSAAFTELAELLAFSLQDLGHESNICINKVAAETTNFIIGCHLLDVGWMTQVPASTIILNTEQIYDDSSTWTAAIFQWAANFEVWDYSERNIQKLIEVGARKVKFLQIGFHQKLARIAKPAVQDIDVLFYGSLNARRRKVIHELQQRGCAARAEFGLYGKQRDELIARSKVVLNLHFYNSQIFEIVRVFYLMTNAKAVVAEVNTTTSIDECYVGGIFPCPYEQLVRSCLDLVADEKHRLELEAKAFATIAKLPQRDFTLAALS